MGKLLPSRVPQEASFTSALVLVSRSSHSLKMRTFSTFDFYRKHEDSMTPAGLAFFQCQWDSSVTWVFHQLLSKKRSVGECCTGLLRGRAVPRTSRTPSVNELLLGSGCQSSLTWFLLSHLPPH